jgi:hypothetical protein
VLAGEPGPFIVGNPNIRLYTGFECKEFKVVTRKNASLSISFCGNKV